MLHTFFLRAVAVAAASCTRWWDWTTSGTRRSRSSAEVKGGAKMRGVVGVCGERGRGKGLGVGMELGKIVDPQG